ncbi:MAG TPA: APC family permease [Candidatus Kapabacteria bacterium]|nr:APC family permease [Candidatus Kapabacteria bacterium]
MRLQTKKVSLKRLIIGSSKDPHDSSQFHKISLLAFLAWVGLGSDGLSSSCYGPSEIWLTLQNHTSLSLLIALATIITIIIISTSYSQIIETFPTGGGGYLVASKLLSPTTGMISGSALIIDYMLTISVSIASGADAIFSFLPPEFLQYKLGFILIVLLALMIMNLRGVKESIMSLIPVFMLFLLTHIFIILYAVITHSFNFTHVVNNTIIDFNRTTSQLGFFGVMFLLLHSYSVGAGTYTGIEAVSNSVPIMREPKTRTAKHTMVYMAASLSFMAAGLLLSYLLYNVKFAPGKTINAVLFEAATSSWNPVIANIFIIITLVSEGAILFVAAQTGFIDGPQVLSRMAIDRWLPTRFASLSDRLVIQNGVVFMTLAAGIILIATDGKVSFLVVLYSINVFITFSLSQLGMVRHWWLERVNTKDWKRKILINGIGLLMTSTILISIIIVKFYEGGWITIFITGAFVAMCLIIKSQYNKAVKSLIQLNKFFMEDYLPAFENLPPKNPSKDIGKSERTAVLLVNGFSGIGLHSLLNIFRLFGDTFKNFVFVEIGLIDYDIFKGANEVAKLEERTKEDVQKYIDFMQRMGYNADGFTATGMDVIEEILKLAPQIREKYPNSVFFGGQLVFEKDTLMNRILHNYTSFEIQKRLYQQGVQFVLLPIKL